MFVIPIATQCLLVCLKALMEVLVDISMASTPLPTPVPEQKRPEYGKTTSSAENCVP